MADETRKIIIEVELKGDGTNAIKNLTSDVKKVKSETKSTTESFGKMDTLIGRVVKTAKKLGTQGGKSLKSFGKIGAQSLKAIGTAIKVAGIGLLVGLLGTLWEAMKRNQNIMDLFETAINAVGIVIQPLAKGLADLITGLANGSDKFDAFGKVITNVVKIALKPLQFTINTIKISVLSLMLAWEKLSAALSKKKELDEGRVEELKASIEETKERMKELAEETVGSFVEIKDNIGEAIDEVKTFGKSVIDETKKAVQSVSDGSAAAATNAKKAIESLKREQEKLKLSYQKEAELLRQIRGLETNSFEEREEANRKLGVLLLEQGEKETAIINEKIAQQQALLALDQDNEEQKNALLDLQNELLEIEERITSQQSEQLANVNTLNNEKKAIAKEEIERQVAISDEIRRILQETAVAELKDANEAALLKLKFDKDNFDRELQQRLTNEEITQEELQALRKAYGEQYLQNVVAVNSAIETSTQETADANTEIARIETQAKIDGALTAAESMLGAADAVFGETKAGAIAKTIITTYESATNAFNSLAGIPIIGPVLGGIAAGAAVAAGIANVNKIRQESKPASSGIKRMALGGQAEIQGPLHSNRGVMIEAQGGEGFVNRAAMMNPYIKSQVNKFNSIGNGASHLDVGDFDERIALIAAAVVQQTEVINVESKSTGLARVVKNREAFATRK